MDYVCFDVFDYILNNFLRFDDVLQLRLTSKSQFEKCESYLKNPRTFPLQKYILKLGRMIDSRGTPIDDKLLKSKQIDNVFPAIGAVFWKIEKGMVLIDMRSFSKGSKYLFLRDNTFENWVFEREIFVQPKFAFYESKDHKFYLCRIHSKHALKIEFDLKNDDFKSQWVILPRNAESLPFLLKDFPPMKKLGTKDKSILRCGQNDLLIVNDLTEQVIEYSFSHFDFNDPKVNQTDIKLRFPDEWGDAYPGSEYNIKYNGSIWFYGGASRSKPYLIHYLVWIQKRIKMSFQIPFKNSVVTCLLMDKDSVWFGIQTNITKPNRIQVRVLQAKSDGSLWITKLPIKEIQTTSYDQVVDVKSYFYDHFIVLYDEDFVLRIDTLNTNFIRCRKNTNVKILEF